jgi:hypothetical protein
MAATYNGQAIFGYSVTMPHVVNPPAEQINAFFGVSGQQSLYGGTRGRVFEVSGLLYGADLIALNAAEDLFLSYIDGIARVLVDTRGRAWPNVICRTFQPQGRVIRDNRGYYLPYRALLTGLI